MKQMDNARRFVNFKDGKGTIDLDMDPKVLAAQIAHAQKQTKSKSKVTGFTQPSTHALKKGEES